MATRARQFKDGICEQVARVGKAMAAPRRLELLEELLPAKGFTAHRMEQGVPDWRARGWRVTTAGTRTPARQRRGGHDDHGPPRAA